MDGKGFPSNKAHRLATWSALLIGLVVCRLARFLARWFWRRDNRTRRFIGTQFLPELRFVYIASLPVWLIRLETSNNRV